MANRRTAKINRKKGAYLSIARLPFSVRAGWAAGSFVTTTLLFLTTTFFLRFMTDYIGLAAGLAGVLLASTKLFDAAINPAIGILSDNTNPRFGRRRPYLAIGALLGAGSLAMMFNVPEGLSQTVCAIYVFFALILASLAYTTFNVPYLAMPAEMTEAPEERAVLMSYRIYTLAAAQFIAGGLGPFLVQSFGSDRAAYGKMSILFGVAIIAAGLLCVLATRGVRATSMQAAAKSQFWSSLPTLFRSRRYIALIMVKMTFLIGSTAHTAAAAYYVHYVMRANDATLSLFLLVYSLGMVASQFVWLRAATRLGKVRGFIVAASLYTVISLTWACLNAGAPITLFILLSALNGIGAGGILLMTESMLPDAIEDDFILSGQRREGTLASLFTFAEKASHAAGLAGVGLVLSYFSYAAPAPGGALSASGITGVMAAFGLMPAAFVGASCLWWLLIGSKPSLDTLKEAPL